MPDGVRPQESTDRRWYQQWGKIRRNFDALRLEYVCIGLARNLDSRSGALTCKFSVILLSSHYSCQNRVLFSLLFTYLCRSSMGLHIWNAYSVYAHFINRWDGNHVCAITAQLSRDFRRKTEVCRPWASLEQQSTGLLRFNRTLVPTRILQSHSHATVNLMTTA
jgi:hypothetical protein